MKAKRYSAALGVALLMTAGAAVAADAELPAMPSTIEAAATTEAAFDGIVATAVRECRSELAGDIYANLRIEACVKDRVAASLREAGAPDLVAYADGHQDYFIVISRR